MSDIRIEIVDIVVQKVGNYSKMTVTHKIQLGSQTKIDAKALVDFATSKDVWATLAKAQKGAQFTIHREKDAKEGKYWQWVGIDGEDGPGPEHEQHEEQSVTESKKEAPAKVSFAEQDAKRQRYIIRQTALKAAVEFCCSDTAEIQQVLDTASDFAKWLLEE